MFRNIIQNAKLRGGEYEAWKNEETLGSLLRRRVFSRNICMLAT